MTDLGPPKRARFARMAAEVKLVLGALVAFALLPILYVAAPGSMLPDPYSTVRMAVAIGLASIGFAWMLLIYREAVQA